MGTNIGYASSEGGPILIADVRAIQHWGGCEKGDYDRCCEELEKRGNPLGCQIQILSEDAIIWDIVGAGTSF